MTWGEIKQRVDNLHEPKDESLVIADPKNEGVHGSDKHALTKYEMVFDKDPDGLWEILFSWSRCENCSETRWKKFTAINNRDNVVYQRYLQRHGVSV